MLETFKHRRQRIGTGSLNLQGSEDGATERRRSSLTAP